MGDIVNLYFSEVSKVANEIPKNKINKMVEILSTCRKKSGRVFFLGVGGSAGNCSHAVNDFRKLCKIEAYTPTDNVSELTARTNDEGWDTVFEEYLKISKLNKNDIIFIFSVGGGNQIKKVSINLIKAIKYAKKRGSKVLSIVGKKDGYAFSNSDVSVNISTNQKKFVTPLSEAFQAVVWHCLVSHPDLSMCKTKW